MTLTHDIFLRAYAVRPDQKKKRKSISKNQDGRKWPEQALVFDTETRITADQSLTFGVYRLCELAGAEYRVTQEGLFHADNLSAKDRKVLEKYGLTAISDVPSFPPEFPLYDRSEFMRRVFWPAIKRRGALVCGLNLVFDLARPALCWNRGSHDEWSLTMSQFPNGVENRNRPRILITPIDSKKAFIGLARPWNPKQWKDEGKAHFLDLRTLGWALFNQPFSLRTLCKQLKTKHQKLDHDPTGEITPEEIEYARQDGRCTVDALNGLKQEFDNHPVGLKPITRTHPRASRRVIFKQWGSYLPQTSLNLPTKTSASRSKLIMVGDPKLACAALKFPWFLLISLANIQLAAHC